ncbi:MAG TPA: hypothetical protein VJV39_05470 [Dongiaceae bacterium]|nr:hypothetical protein [Dongiaceae bacterium]
MNIKLAGIASAILAAVVIAVPAAQSDEMDAIDCSSSSFAFSGEGFNVDCERSNDQVRAGESSGATQIDVMTISGEEPRMFMTVVGVRITATRLYMEYRGLRQNFSEAFTHIEVQDWNGIGNKGGYDSAEFTAVISGLPSSCVAIQRYTNAAWTGFKRRMIGMGCSTVDRSHVYDAIAKLRAPGD